MAKMDLSANQIAGDTIAKDKIEAFCQRWEIQELAFFGSVLREDFDSSRSDLDLLVTFADSAIWGLLDHVQMENELKHLFQHDVDLVSRRAVEKSHNWIRRKEILDNTKILFSTSESIHASG